MFVSERVGNILIYASSAPNAPQLANVFPAPNINASGESGLMSIELDPVFATNNLLYVCVSVNDGGQWLNQVLRYQVNGNTPVFDRYVIRSGMRANSNHDGCRIRFGPDGKLWVTMGDAGDTANGQNPNVLNGKVLRVNSDGSIPADNPIMPGAAAPRGRGPTDRSTSRRATALVIRSSVSRRRNDLPMFYAWIGVPSGSRASARLRPSSPGRACASSPATSALDLARSTSSVAKGTATCSSR